MQIMGKNVIVWQFMKIKSQPRINLRHQYLRASCLIVIASTCAIIYLCLLMAVNICFLSVLSCLFQISQQQAEVKQVVDLSKKRPYK